MAISTQFASVLSGTVALALMAGCAGGAAPAIAPASSITQEQAMRPLPAGAPSFFNSRIAPPPFARPVAGPGYRSPESNVKGGAALYVTDYNADTVTIFSISGKQTAQITGFIYPEGVTGDATGNVYVNNTGKSEIDEYTAGLAQLEARLSDPNYFPSSTSVAIKTGVVGVANINSIFNKAGSVVFYAKGGTTPCATVTDPNWFQVYFDAFDAQGNLYIDGRDASKNTLVGVVDGGCRAKKIVTLTGAKIAFPGGMQVAPNGNIVIDDQGTGTSTVYTYAPPVKNAFAKPIATTPLTGSRDAVAISLSASGNAIYDADENLVNAQQFAYPAGGRAMTTFTPTGAQFPDGVFVSPAEKP